MLEGAQPLLLVGAGKMGGAMLDGWIQQGLDPGQVSILDPFLEEQRRGELTAAGAKLQESADAPIGQLFKVLVLAVKPIFSLPPIICGALPAP